MTLTFVHVSDIHFGQEKGAEVHYNDDVKECVIRDAAKLVRDASGKATGVLVTGDIAYAGKPNEYQAAGEWLDRLAEAIGCPKTAVQVVPGNHDVDRARISESCEWLLKEICEGGQKRLDKILASPIDHEILYGRFLAYMPFAEGYDCPLDSNGGRASEHCFDLAPNRKLRFIGLNSALICSNKDTKGTLILGARQHVFPRVDGEELILLSHHPIRWFQDHEKITQYLRSRARMFVSGHEHNPSYAIEQVEEGNDIMMLEAGATVPPSGEGGYTYTYNLLKFDLDCDGESLKVTVIPRVWYAPATDFVTDRTALGSAEVVAILGCPSFRRSPNGDVSSKEEASFTEAEAVVSQRSITQEEGSPISPETQLILLRFFRDLSPAQRLSVFFQLDVFPESWGGTSLKPEGERVIFDMLVKSGRSGEILSALEAVQPQTSGNEARK